jgi:hypothetical protein
MHGECQRMKGDEMKTHSFPEHASNQHLTDPKALPPRLDCD